ncbi:MAG: hypothetical protein LQ343_006078 [Gyalolechia ehrenbergii]|nr:MAG: hypothetical protein LQ343_006078 [Gyalolechia ehrenbergii]
MAEFMSTLYLFTAHDLEGTVLLNTVCSITLHAVANASREDFSIMEVFIRTPLVLLWLWVNLLVFNVSNQRRPEAISEDAINKPWRPLPAGRLQRSHANCLLVVLHPVAAVISYSVGALFPCIAFQILTFTYNDLKAGENWKLRNVVNAGGFISFLTGALLVVRGSLQYEHSTQILCWMSLLAVMIASTKHVQDLYDQDGDKLRGRKTIPLVFGDSTARRTIALAVSAWSFVMPTYWRLSPLKYVPSVVLGLVIASRLAGGTRRDIADDKRTYKLWSLWIISLYILPLSSSLFSAQTSQHFIA